MANSIGITDFAVEKRGQQVTIVGKVIDQHGAVLADFGPNGTNFVSWFQKLSADEQVNLVRDIAQRWIVHWLLEQGAR